MLQTISKLISWFCGSPLIAAVISALITSLKSEGSDILEFAITKIKEANDMPNAGPQDKFAMVKQALANRFLNVPESLIDTSIQAAYLFYKTSK